MCIFPKFFSAVPGVSQGSSFSASSEHALGHQEGDRIPRAGPFGPYVGNMGGSGPSTVKETCALRQIGFAGICWDCE